MRSIAAFGERTRPKADDCHPQTPLAASCKICDVAGGGDQDFGDGWVMIDPQPGAAKDEGLTK
ncbi:hypothetical protein GCM10007385_46080 [Tateyamaria omphalii]|nr:hypothetical protein GCM10007385_46080 [Tateyamaria omphalii]